MSPTNLQMRGLVTRCGAALVAAVVLAGAGGATAQVPELAVGSGSGTPGGQAQVTVSLSGAGENAATAQLDVLFDESLLSIADPTTACVKNDRLTAHFLNPTLPGSPAPPEGQKRLRLAILDTMPPIDVLTDGELATCTFDIAAEASLGDVTLAADRIQVAATNGSVLCGPGSDPAVDCAGANGIVSIVPPTDTPTQTPAPPTATVTKTPVPPTATVTKTPVPPTATVTNSPVPPTSTATVTRTATAQATATRTGGGGGGSGDCSIAPAGETSPTGILLLFLGAALLVWGRTRRR